MKIGSVIPSRTAASRLPGKPLIDVAGRSALQRVSARANACPQVQQVVLATTTEASDDFLAEFAAAEGLMVYRGSTQDVFARITEAALYAELDIVVEVDGDDLLCSPEYMTRGVEELECRNADYLNFTGLPFGATPSVLRTAALERALRTKSETDTATGFFRPLTEAGGFRVVKVAVDRPEHIYPEARFTLDYPEDLAFFRATYAELDRLQGPIGLAELLALLRSHPEIMALNAGLEERYWQHFKAGVEQQAG